jgi:hypothetical protein
VHSFGVGQQRIIESFVLRVANVCRVNAIHSSAMHWANARIRSRHARFPWSCSRTAKQPDFLVLFPAGVIKEVPKVLKEVAVEHHLHAAAAE